ncbi:MAG: metal ABC transporter permease [Thaumarchaeota archaeon]|nr:metal ABC transporter permease [Candidatus Calditenuaceae archaeon]MDW8186869.1 metal ABC transporter permease [Nitrososphaerota archaeon]
MVVLLEGFMLRAYVAGILVATILPTVGNFIVPKRLSVISDMAAHVTFGALALATLLNLVAQDLILYGVTALSVIGALWLVRAGGYSGDIAAAIFLALGAATASIALSLGSRLSLQGILFGSILLVGWEEVVSAAAVLAVIGLTLAARYKALLLYVLSGELTRLRGYRPELIEVLLALLSSMAIVSSIKLLGVLMVTALTVIPVASASSLATSMKRSVVLSIAIAQYSVLSGLSLSYFVGFPPGAMTVLTALTALLVTSLLSRVGVRF